MDSSTAQQPSTCTRTNLGKPGLEANHRARNLQEIVKVRVSNTEGVNDQRLSSNSANTHSSQDQDMEDKEERV